VNLLLLRVRRWLWQLQVLMLMLMVQVASPARSGGAAAFLLFFAFHVRIITRRVIDHQ